MNITLLGLSYKTSTLELREKLHLTAEQTPDFIGRLRSRIAEVVVFSTCNRFEILAAHEQTDIRETLVTTMSDYFKVPQEEFEHFLYCYSGFEAVQHLFRVSSSLDSMVVGEAQILGQMKQFYAIAQQEQSTGSSLHTVMERAFMVAKKVRTETGIASNSVSIPSVAVDLACRIFGEMETKTALVIGAGKMGLLALQHLRAQGVQKILITNRTFSKASSLAEEIQGKAILFEELGQYLSDADIVIGSSGAEQTVVHKDQVQSALCIRKNKPMFLIDIAVPRDMDPSIHELSNVYLYNVDDLEKVAEKNRLDRKKEAKLAEAMVLDEAKVFWKKLQTLDANPMIRSIRQTVEEICKQELATCLPRLGPITNQQQETVEKLVSRLSDKILQNPFSQMRQLAAEPGSTEKIDFIGKLFHYKV